MQHHSSDWEYCSNLQQVKWVVMIPENFLAATFQNYSPGGYLTDI